MLAPRRIAYLNRLYSKSEMDAVGFKLMYGHPRMHPGLLPYLALRRVRALHLVRTNLLDQVLSWETARARGLFRAHAGDDVPQTTVRLETESLVDRLEELEARIERGRRTLRRMRVPTLEIEYEQLVERPAALISEAFRFLNVDSADDWAPGSTLVRMNWTPRLELIENVDEVARTLRGTRFSSMLGSAASNLR
jgi:LPS sulfotransferase NodH